MGLNGGISNSQGPIESGSTTGMITEGNAGLGWAAGTAFTAEGNATNPSDYMNPINGVSSTVFPKIGAGLGAAMGVGQYTATKHVIGKADGCECE